MEKRNLVSVRQSEGKYIMEILLPHVFTAFPITELGIKQFIEDCTDALKKIEDEKTELASHGD